MSFIVCKEINNDYCLAFEEDNWSKQLSPGAAVIRKNPDGGQEQITPTIFSPSFIERIPFPEGYSGCFYHLHVNRETVINGTFYDILGSYINEYSINPLLGSYLFLDDFSEHVQFELLFDHISFEEEEEDNFLIGTIGGMSFKGHLQFGRDPKSIIPIKYKQIIFGRRFYVAAYDGQGWDIYDNFNMDDNHVHYMTENRYGEVELSGWGSEEDDYYCSLEKKRDVFGTVKEDKRKLLYRRLLRTKVPSITDHLDEPYPITDTGSIDLIGVPRGIDRDMIGVTKEVDGDNLFSVVMKSPYPKRDEGPCHLESYSLPNDHNGHGPDYFYIVTRNNKKGLWHNDIINRTYRVHHAEQKVSLYGIGKIVLDCHYLDIIPIKEDILLYYTRQGHPVSYRACNAFSIQSESGWGVYDGRNKRTLLPPVFDEPATVILGPEGYICRINMKYGIIDKNGDQFLPFIYDKIEIINEEANRVLTSEEDYYWEIKTTIKCVLNGDESDYTLTHSEYE